MDHVAAADRLIAALHLDAPPVALAFVDQAPADVAHTDGAVPSACSFWRPAEHGTFYASAAAHANCPVGAMVMGFELSEATSRDLMSAAELMVGCGYLGRDEIPRIPSMPDTPRGVVYGPLREFAPAPTLVLLWLSPREAMRFAEAAGSCAWTSSAVGGLLGRPACAALPTAHISGQAVLSLGCAGMRTFTEIAGDRLLGVVPGERLASFVEALERTVHANAEMQRFYDGRKAQLSPA